VVLLLLEAKKEKPPWWTSLICNWKGLTQGFVGLTDILGRGSDQIYRLCHIVERQAISSKVVALSSQ